MARSSFRARRVPHTLPAGLACAVGLAAPALAQAQDVTLQVWSDPTRMSVFEAYDAADNGVSLDISTVAPDELVTKLQLAMRAGSDVPDVVWMSTIDVAAQLSTRRTDYLLDLAPYVDEATLDEFSTNANAPCRFGEELLCLRNDVAQYVTWYDKAKLEELGAEVPETWEQFRALGAELAPDGYALGSGVEPFLLLGIFASSGCDIAIPQEAENTVAIDLSTPECTKAAKLVDDMRADGSLAPFGAFDPEFIALAVDGELPLMVAPTWFGEFVLRRRYEFAEGTLTAAVPPRWEDQDEPLTWSGGGGAFGGHAGSERPEAVAELIVWATTDPEVQAAAVTTPAHVPSAKLWLANMNEGGYFADAGAAEAIEEAATYTHPGYKPLRFNVVEAIGKVVVPGLGAGRTVESMLPELQKELENLAQLNRYDVD